MPEINSLRPFMVVFVSFFFSILIFLTGNLSGDLRNLWSIIAASIKFIIIVSMIPAILEGTIFKFVLFELAPGITLMFRTDALSAFFGLMSSMLWLITTVYTIGYMKEEKELTRFFGFFALCICSTMGIAFAGNMFTLFLFYEMLTICTYPLLIHDQTPLALKVGRKYLIYTLTGSAFLLFAIIMTYNLSGTIDLNKNGILDKVNNPFLLFILFYTYIIGFGIKGVIMPLHGWLPDSMVAPTPVTALLHSVAVVKVGIFGIIRVIFNIFGYNLVKSLGLTIMLSYFAVFTIIAASVMAMYQNNLKRRLAYSTISQLSYIILGASLLTFSSVTGGIMHIAHQAVMKITLFFCAGSIFKKTGKRYISDMDGIGWQQPVTIGAFSIAALGIIGLPPMVGFITKWYLGMGAIEADKPFFAGVILLSSLLNAIYFLPIIYKAFFKKPLTDEPVKISEPHWTIVIPCVITAFYSIALGVFPNLPGFPLSLAKTAVLNFFK
ncbi:MAG: monovalent cation/H+ antiporter subunit D family protein [Candidatus Firestonebacteria bacterium]|nr:monovalent cation/H+ antiporter subunit D family protein [Candidatus Firestonebacteria bacterium]